MKCFTGPALGEGSKNVAVGYNEYIAIYRAFFGRLQSRGMPIVTDIPDQTVQAVRDVFGAPAWPVSAHCGGL